LQVHHWASFEERKQNQVSDQAAITDVVNPLYGLDPRGIRDWNEEYQLIKDFPMDGLPQRA
jgi:protein TIF31